MKCPKCGCEDIRIETVVENKKVGCSTVLLYIILACTVLGLFIVIPLMLRKKDKAVKYATCQNCGKSWIIK